MKKNPHALVLLAVLGALCLAAPVRADHNYAPPGVRSVGVRIGQPAPHATPHAHRAPRVITPQRSAVIVDVQRGYGGHHDGCGCDECCARRDYDRGYERGVERGHLAGYRDGAYGRQFNDCAAPPPDQSRQFQRGFIDAFACAYRDGFEQGVRACARRVPVRESGSCGRSVAYVPWGRR